SVRTWRPVGDVMVSVTDGTLRDREYESNAPSLGFSQAYSPCAQLEKSSQTKCCVIGRGVKMCAGLDATVEDHDASGDASSRIQMLRPWVPRIRSLVRGWTRMSKVGTVGRFDLKRDQVRAVSVVR